MKGAWRSRRPQPPYPCPAPALYGVKTEAEQIEVPGVLWAMSMETVELSSDAVDEAMLNTSVLVLPKRL